MSVAFDPTWSEPGAPDWLVGESPAGSPTDLPVRGADRPNTVRLTGLATTGEGLSIPPPMLVLGSAGSSGSTVVATNLASVMAADNVGYVFPTVVDATPAGGDLALRACDEYRTTATVQTWLDDREPSLPSAVADAVGRASSGATVLARGGESLPRRGTWVSVHRHLIDAGSVPVYDCGAPVSALAVRPLLHDPRIPVALTVQARPDAINRLSAALRWLDDQFGESVVGDITIVLTHQNAYPDPYDYADHLRTYVADWVHAVVDIPYDQHLAQGDAISWNQLSQPTQAAYRQLLQDMR